MCGFVGFVDKKKNKKKIIKNMADLIKHRGPDSDGYYNDDNCALGFRRLSIIDLDGGTQPIYNDKNDMVISEEKINVSINDIQSAHKLFKKINFKNLVDVKYDVIVYSNNDYEFAFQNLEGLGLLLEFENENDFEGVSDEAIANEKQKMYEIIKNYGIKVENNYDIKKAYELVMKKLS